MLVWFGLSGLVWEQAQQEQQQKQFNGRPLSTQCANAVVMPCPSRAVCVTGRKDPTCKRGGDIMSGPSV